MTSSRTGVIVSKVKFTLEPPSQANLIRGYSDTELRIGEQRVRRSCLVTADRLITDWPPATFDELAPAQLGAACRTFNVLVQEERRVAAVLFVR